MATGTIENPIAGLGGFKPGSAPAAPIPMPSAYRPFSRSRTTYGGMNEWMKMQGNIIPNGIPITHTGANWRHISETKPRTAYVERDPMHYDEFQKAYEALAKNVAYRYPTPGLPKLRQGRVGASWRHIKEVLTDAGSRTFFIDGRVKIYDQDNFNELLHKQRYGGRLHTTAEPLRPHMPPTPQWSVNRHDVSSYRKGMREKWEKHTYKPWYSDNRPMPLPVLPERPSTGALSRKTPTVDNTEKYRGFYAIRS